MFANCSYMVNSFQNIWGNLDENRILLEYETAIIAIYHSRFYTDLYHGLEVKGHIFCPQPKKQDAPCALCKWPFVASKRQFKNGLIGGLELRQKCITEFITQAIIISKQTSSERLGQMGLGGQFLWDQLKWSPKFRLESSIYPFFFLIFKAEMPQNFLDKIMKFWQQCSATLVLLMMCTSS